MKSCRIKHNIFAFDGQDNPLSNFHQVHFFIPKDMIYFKCIEQYLMYSKAQLFHDKEKAQQILQQHLPWRQKWVGRKVKLFDPVLWKTSVSGILMEGLEAKFSQNKSAREYLLQTDNATIVKASPYDGFYGAGIALYDDDIWNQALWSKNILGQSLMTVREKFKNNK
jgi:hypothetical protein